MIETRKVSESNEQRLLRACLIGQEIFADINDQTNDDYFFVREYKVIFNAYRKVFTEAEELSESNIKPIIAHDLIAIKKFDELLPVDVEESDVKNIIKILKEKVEIRELYKIKGFLTEQLESNETSHIIFGLLNEKLLKFGNEQADQMESVGDILQKEIPDPKHPPEVTSELLGVPTGLSKLDKITKGYEKKQITIIAARTSSGKSSLSYQSALATAIGGGRVLIYTLEDSKTSAVDRLLCAAGEISNYKVSYRKFPAERDKIKFIKHMKS